MIVGCLGDISFAVFDSHVETIKNMVQNVSARYTTHQRAGGPALTEFTGTDGMAADWRMVNRSINPVALGIIAAQYFKAVGIYWYDGCAIVHTDTRDAKATWLCDAPRHYPSTTYQKFILPTIRRGCTGDANRAATKMLQRLLGLTPDGIFGEGTENALLKAQEAHGLTVDGICGPASWKAISGASKYL